MRRPPRPRNAFLPRAAFVVLAFALSVCAAGCVTRSAYEALEAERNDLARRNAELSGLAVTLDRSLRIRDHEIVALEREQQELADDVARWASAGAVQMMMLADGLHLVLPHDVLFASGSTELSSEGRQLIAELVEELGQQPYQIAVRGFTDNVPIGPALAERYPSNWELSGARAASVVRAMEAEGIPAEQLIAVSRGETGAVATNATPEGRAANRRIDIRIRPIVVDPS